MLSSQDHPSHDMANLRAGFDRRRVVDRHYDSQHQRDRDMRTSSSVDSRYGHNSSFFHEDSETDNSAMEEPPRMKPLPIDSPHRPPIANITLNPSSSPTERTHRSQKSPTHQKKFDRFIATRKIRQASSHSTSPSKETDASNNISPSYQDMPRSPSDSKGPSISESSFSHTIPGASSFEELVSFDAHNSVTPKKSTLLHSFGANSPSISPRKEISPGNLPDEYSFHVEDADSYTNPNSYMDATTSIVIPDIVRERNVFDIGTSDNILPHTMATTKTASSDTASVVSMKRGAADDDSVSQATLIHYGTQMPRLYHRPGVRDPGEMKFGYIDEEESVLLSFADNASTMAQRMTDTQTYKSAQDELKEGVTELTNMTMRDPSMPMAIGISAAALIGAFLLGPVGVVVGTAAVGISVGFMQIPEAQRTHAVKKLNEFLDSSYQSVCSTDTSPCVHPLDGNIGFHSSGNNTSRSETPKAMDRQMIETALTENLTASPANHPRILQDGGHGKIFERQVMVMRKNKVIPLNQIHSLEPAKQPRAWLDVLASASSNMDEKTEAMEEILIWSKDKAQARRYLEEGILDSLLFIIRTFSETYTSSSADASFNSRQNPYFYQALLASNCCIALAKAHAAAILANGELYSGNVPIARQCAVMLMETPHFIAVETDDGTEPGYMFKVSNIALIEAEDFGRMIVSLSQGEMGVSTS